MNIKKTIWPFALLLLLGLGGQLQAQTASDILRKSEEIRRGVQSSASVMNMTIVRPDWTRTMTIKSWSKGEDYALMLITAPARDKGNVTLKRKKEIWNWRPKIERTVKLPPSMMSQSWMGSDYTNDDFVRESSYEKDYQSQILGDTTIQGRKCWKIEMIPNEETAIVWGKIHLWVDQEDYLQLRGEYYDEDNYLINIMEGSQIKNMDGRDVVTRIEMIPVEEDGHKTVVETSSIEFDNPISENFFSVQNMKRIQ
ncbi:outer membrane lipoprotein-sorting protein [Pontibacter sp. G13]|uniref:outer membrane lipoprotein-sorting protein n=1 Tax=Pontibacter sp. G13 TaxID=3074898 RepID=UPI00288B3E23|nr:outer membrane lipoprotein-sorting protein [Pontibacter sp. G13]WNJ18599.1 outer membrane lipoprotein-sorting protein [Pontibacter sp. G13]